MIGLMWGMYRNSRANWGIVAGNVAVFAASLFLVRSQETVSDVAWMKAMVERLEANPVPKEAPDLPSYRDRGAPPPPPETRDQAGGQG